MHRRSHHASTSISHEWKAPFPFNSFEIQLFFCVNKGKTNKLPVAKTKRFFCNFLPSFFFLVVLGLVKGVVRGRGTGAMPPQIYPGEKQGS